MNHEAKNENVSTFGRHGAIIFDEMAIQVQGHLNMEKTVAR